MEKGKIPRAYCNVKDKDNDKSRLISASHEASLRTLLKLAGKALTHLLIHLPEQHTQFTLHSLADLKKRITDMSGKLTRTHRDDSSSHKQMLNKCLQTSTKMKFSERQPGSV